MDFIRISELLQENFNRISENAEYLFEVDVDKEEMWNLYLDSFPKGTNEIYRKRREFDCSCCRNFIKALGNVVVIKDNIINTIWGFEIGDETFQTVFDALNEYVKSKTVTNVYIGESRKIGTKSNLELLNDDLVITWNHLFLEIPEKFIKKGFKTKETLKGNYRDSRNVFKRSLDEITEGSLLTVLELISQNSLYKGKEWTHALHDFLRVHKEYNRLDSDELKNNYAWEQSTKAGAVISRIRNLSIGTLLVNISEGMNLDDAVGKYEAIVAPTNYKRPKAIFTAKMLKDAQKTIEDLGYLDSLGRRYATLDDISVNNILFSNKDAAKRIQGASVFDDMLEEIAIDPKRFSKVEEISIDNFINNVLPSATEVQVLVENNHANNMVSLIAPENQNSRSMFKWDNSFSWAYAGNITDSLIKSRVKSAGGNTDAALRFSIQWNDIEKDTNDLDAHCIEPTGYEIYYACKRYPSPTRGTLDVDIINPGHEPAVENIAWPDFRKMDNGVYKFFVHCYSNWGGKGGFRAEIEANDQIHSFDYNEPLRQEEIVNVAEVTYNNGDITIKDLLPSSKSSKKVWNISTNQFVPVTVIMNSPNYWDDQKGIGHKHYFFMLKDCVNPETPNGFYNEFLKNELEHHRRVFEALGSRMAVKDVDDQLSGLGFSSTKRNHLIVKVKGSTERVLKLVF